VRTITFDLSGIMVYVDPIWVKFDGQGRRTNYKVTEVKRSF